MTKIDVTKSTAQVPLEPQQGGVSASKSNAQVPLEQGDGSSLVLSKTYATAVMAPAWLSVSKTYATAVMVPPDQRRSLYPMKF